MKVIKKDAVVVFDDADGEFYLDAKKSTVTVELSPDELQAISDAIHSVIKSGSDVNFVLTAAPLYVELADVKRSLLSSVLDKKMKNR